jgi:hypothetical protein
VAVFFNLNINRYSPLAGSCGAVSGYHSFYLRWKGRPGSFSIRLSAFDTFESYWHSPLSSFMAGMLLTFAI